MISLRKSSVGVYTYRTFYIHKLGEPGLRLFWIRWGRKGSRGVGGRAHPPLPHPQPHQLLVKGSHSGSLWTLCDLQGCSAGPLIFKNAFWISYPHSQTGLPTKIWIWGFGGKIGRMGPILGLDSHCRGNLPPQTQAVTPVSQDPSTPCPSTVSSPLTQWSQISSLPARDAG